MIERVVLIENAVETLGYFSQQIAMAFAEDGLETYFVNYNRLVDTVEGLYRFLGCGNTALCTFNFVGLSGEEIFIEENGKTIWENHKMPCLNIMVDHPLYYHSKLEKPYPYMKVFCVDREHIAYMKRFYPEVRADFLPLAGNVILPQQTGYIPYEKRSYDIVFTGNYTPVEHIYHKIDELEEDYRNFYRDIIEDLIAHPSVSMDTMLERHIQQELGAVSEVEKRAAIAGMVFIDICIRSYFRGEIIRLLAEQGVTVHVFGANWEKLSCKNPENIISSGKEVDSRTCAMAIANARLALNIMPWFKNGAHDRVFTAMLQKTLALTDKSLYLQEQFVDGKEIAFYSLEEHRLLPDKVKELLAHPQAMMEMAENGYRRAALEHTWKQRAGILETALKEESV